MGEEGTTAYLGLGSNMGERQANLELGIAFFRNARGIRLLRISPLYETEPWRMTNQPDFLNCVIAISAMGGARHLLDLCHEAETRAGRLTRGDLAPRPLDVDILTFGDEIISTPSLSIPHPRVVLRRFVLVPLSDIAPNMVIPGTDKKVITLLKECPDEIRVTRVSEVES